METMTEQSQKERPKLVDNLKHRVSPEENERWFQERGGTTTVTFVNYDPKTGKRPTLIEID